MTITIDGIEKDITERGTVLTAEECEAVKDRCREEGVSANLAWGSYGENNDGTKKVRYVCDLETKHIENILMCGHPPPLYVAAMIEELRKRGDFNSGPVNIVHQYRSAYGNTARFDALLVNGYRAYYSESELGIDIQEVCESLLEHLEIPYESSSEVV